MSIAEYLLFFIVAGIAGLALYVAIKAHMHQTSFVGEVRHEFTKAEAATDAQIASAVADVKDHVETVVADAKAEVAKV